MCYLAFKSRSVGYMRRFRTARLLLYIGCVLHLVHAELLHLVHAERTVLQLNLCTLCSQLSQHIPDIGGDGATGATGPTCSWHACLNSNKFNALRANALSIFKADDAALAGDFKHIANTTFMQLNFTSDHAAELLVMAFMGRHLIQSTPEQTLDVPATFSYNVVKRQLQISYPVCRYEKTFYMGLLVVSVIVIILALGLRFWERNKQDEEERTEDIESSESSEAPPQTMRAHIPRVLSANVVRVGAIQRSDIRYRAVSTEIT